MCAHTAIVVCRYTGMCVRVCDNTAHRFGRNRIKLLHDMKMTDTEKAEKAYADGSGRVQWQWCS